MREDWKTFSALTLGVHAFPPPPRRGSARPRPACGGSSPDPKPGLKRRRGGGPGGVPLQQRPAMARDRGPPVLRPPRAAALPAEPRGWGWLGAGLWPALLVGLLAAIVAWFWYGDSDGRAEAGGEEAAAGREGPRRASTVTTGSGMGRRCRGCPGLPEPARTWVCRRSA